MAFNVYNKTEDGAYFTLLIISIPVTILAIVLRFSATRSTGRKPAMEDWLALAALIVFLARVGVALGANIIANGRGAMLAFDKPEYELVFKLAFVADMITLLDQTLAKLSICALYLRLFGVKRSNRIWVYILAALQILSYLVLVILQPLQCRPINKFWQYWAEGECLSFSVILAAVEPLNSVIDFALVILAIFMIRSLKMKVDAKWKLCFLFGLGSLAGIFGFVKMGLSYDYKPETIVVLGLWAVVQSVAGIICCCAPVFRPMPIVTVAWDGIRSKLSNYSLRSLLTSKSNTVGASGVGSGYVHEAGSSHTQEEDLLRYDRGHNRWVITSDSGDPTTPNRYPMEFIQVKKSVDVV